MAGITDTQSLRFGQVTDPISWTMQRDLADDIAAQLDAADTARTAALKRPTAMARRSASLSIPVAPTITTVTFDQEVAGDTYNMIDLATQATRITVSAAAGAGVYMAQAVLQGSYTSWTRGDLILSRTGVFYGQRTWYSPQDLNVLSACWMVNMPSVGDYFTLGVYHEGGGSTGTVDISLRVFKISN
jgi:hypothetical protein